MSIDASQPSRRNFLQAAGVALAARALPAPVPKPPPPAIQQVQTPRALPRTIDRVALERDLCMTSFFDFFLRFWPTYSQEKLILNWHIEYLCSELQQMAERVFRREPKEHDLIINISPGSTKSTICSVMFPAWCWTRDKSFRMICGSYAYPLSLHLANQCKRVLTSDKYKELFPDVVLDSESKGLLETPQGGQRISTSTGGSITGMHGHVILIDDPLNPKEAVSDVSLKGANEWFDQTLLSRMINKKVTPVILIMQRLHQNDPTAHMLAKKTSVRHVNLPATVNDEVRPRNLRKRYKEGLFDPERLPRPVLERTELEMGTYAYNGQYMQRPVPPGGGMFHVSEVKICEVAKRCKRMVRYWDKAGTGGDGCYTVGTLMGEDAEGFIWVLDVVRGQWEAFTREKIIKQTAQLDGPLVMVAVEQEPGSGGKESAESTLRNLRGFRVKIDKVTGDKIIRADPFAAQMNGGFVKVKNAPWTKEWLNEFRFFPFSTYKDQVDSGSGAFNTLFGKGAVAGAFGADGQGGHRQKPGDPFQHARKRLDARLPREAGLPG